MLDLLDDSTFADLRHAYGKASDVPELLRGLTSDDLDEVGDALHELGAAIFHQGSYYSATAPAVPFLIELGDAEIAGRAEVLLFLADMSGSPADAELAFQPYLFRSSPGLPNYPEAVATIDAIRAGRDTYLRALECADPRARACAATLLLGLGVSPEPIADAHARETDEHARITLSFACARMGLALEPVTEPSLLADVVAVLRAEHEPELALPAIGRLLRLERPLPRESVSYFDGDLVRFAALVLVERFAADPRAFDLAADALTDRFARGEQIQPLPGGPTLRISDEAPPPITSFAEYFADVPLRTIAGSMAALAFGDRARDPALLRRDQLDGRMRRVLALTVDHGIPVPVAGAPWIDATSMARFLAGDGPLDRLVAFGDKLEPLYVHLGALTRARDPNEHAAEVDALFAELALNHDHASQPWTPAELVELAIDIFANGYDLAPYGPPQPPIRAAIAKYIAPLANQCPELFEAYAERLLTAEHPTGAAIEFVFTRGIAAREPVDLRFDRIAGMAIVADPEHGREWLLCFPEPRRSQIVARFGNAYLYNRFAADCDRPTLEAAVTAGFLDPSCSWFEHEAESLLATFEDRAKLAGLREQTSGRRRTVVDRVLERVLARG